MAGNWIKMRTELGQDPDVIQISVILGIDEFAVVGRLHAVWSWLDQHSENGTNVRIVSAYLDRLTACPGFADAMRTVGWLDGRDGNLTFPGYETHNGETAKRRAVEAKRKREQRDKCSAKHETNVPIKLGQMSHKTQDKCPSFHGTNVPLNTGPEKRREDSSTDTTISAESPESPTDQNMSDRAPSLQYALATCATIGVDPEVGEIWWNEANARPRSPRGYFTDRDGNEMQRWQSNLKAYGEKWRINQKQRDGQRKPHTSQPMRRSKFSYQIPAAESE